MSDLRENGDGYEVLTWVNHQPSGIVVLEGHPQLGGRYCEHDGGDWPCAAVRAAPADARRYRVAIDAAILNFQHNRYSAALAGLRAVRQVVDADLAAQPEPDPA